MSFKVVKQQFAPIYYHFVDQWQASNAAMASQTYYCENCGSPRAKFKARYAYGTVLSFCGQICQIGHWQRGIGENTLNALRRADFVTTVIKVSDGDTIWVNVPVQPVEQISHSVGSAAKVKRNTTIKIRMRGIDAPESSQPYGDASTALLSSLIMGREVRVKSFGFGKYGRMLADVYEPPTATETVQTKLVRAGLAWYYRRFDPKRKLWYLHNAEVFAQKARLGLWEQRAPEKPGAYRTRIKRERAIKAKMARKELAERKREEAFERAMEKLGENMYYMLDIDGME
jgi:endonuclease YncB( thermonuclease family)